MRYVFDAEADNLYDGVTKLHCIVLSDLDTGQMHSFGPSELEQGLSLISGSAMVVGHNIAEYDLPVFEKLYPGFESPKNIIDTRAVSRVLYPGEGKTSQLRKLDFKLRRKHGEDALPAQMIGRHSLEAWALRLRLPHQKVPYEDWSVWTAEMQHRCEQDVLINVDVWRHFESKGWPLGVFEVESQLSYQLFRQQRFGIGFDVSRAVEFLGELQQEKHELKHRLQAAFGDEYVPEGKGTIPKRSASSKMYEPGHEKYRNVEVGCEYQKIRRVEFNPGSGLAIARNLTRKYGWNPIEFTPTGEPKVTAEILRDLPYTEAADLAKFQQVKKILGYLSEGKNAWLALERDGRLHGRMNATGAVTHRGSHKEPNLGNIPSRSSLGKRCRTLFVPSGGSVPPGWSLVGADASSLQLALYAHYVARYDEGRLAEVVSDPNEDAHEYMRRYSGLYFRDNQKTLTYAKWFGAMAPKLGTTVLHDLEQAKEAGLFTHTLPNRQDIARLGKIVERRMQKRMAGYAELQRHLKRACGKGYLNSLSGRRVPVAQSRLALVSLLQSGEKDVMANAYLDARPKVEELGARLSLWVHDEIQACSPPEVAEEVGQILAASICQQTERFELRITLGADYKIGDSWAETH